MAYSHHVIHVIHSALTVSIAREEVADGREVYKEGPGFANTSGAMERTQKSSSYVAT